MKRVRPRRPAASPRRRSPAPPRRRRGGPRTGVDPGATRAAIFAAGADAFSRRGFDGVIVDDIARAARVNKAMLYYHFDDKLGLYRAIVGEMLHEASRTMSDIAAADVAPADKLKRFIAAFVALGDARPYFPTLMLREMAEGALHLDLEIFAMMRSVFLAFGRILAEGRESGQFREVHPVLAYMSVLAPMLLNAARERAGAQPGRADLPMFVRIPHRDLAEHMQTVALRMLRKD